MSDTQSDDIAELTSDDCDSPHPKSCHVAAGQQPPLVPSPEHPARPSLSHRQQCHPLCLREQQLYYLLLSVLSINLPIFWLSKLSAFYLRDFWDDFCLLLGAKCLGYLSKKKDKKGKEVKRYNFSTSNIAKLKLWNKVKCHQAQQREDCWDNRCFLGMKMFIMMCAWMWTLYLTIVALFSSFLLFIFRWPWNFIICCVRGSAWASPWMKGLKGQWVSVTLVKVKVYLRGWSCTWISLCLHRGGRGGQWDKD